jgi:hypothetical protein
MAWAAGQVAVRPSENVLMTPHTATAAALALSRQAVTAVAAGRVALGVVALVRPSVPARPWVGAAAADLPASRVLGRALGARDLALGLGALAATARKPSAGPWQAGAWFAAGALADALDATVTLAAWQRLPRTRWLIVASAGGAAVVGAAGTVALCLEKSALERTAVASSGRPLWFGRRRDQQPPRTRAAGDR